MKKTAIFYGSSTGNTESIAKAIAEKINADTFDVTDKPIGKIEEYQNLILGTSTWGFGDLQDDWVSFLPMLANADLSGKNIALFGLGDGSSYPDTFVDGMGMIYNAIKDKGCSIVGEVSADSYCFEASAAKEGDSFVGLAIDEDNERNLTDIRVEKWLDCLKPIFE